MKDGGPESYVSGFFLIEIKRAFSIVLLRFDDGSREAFHSHAFDAVSWLLRGRLVERVLVTFRGGDPVVEDIGYAPSARPIVTRRARFHQVFSIGESWVLSFRGPWAARWREYIPTSRRFITLTHGRQVA